MHVRLLRPEDRDVLADIWLRSVQATHAFLTEDDIQDLLPKVREYLAMEEPEFWVLCDDDSNLPIGFMGLSPDRIQSLFLAPEHFRRGGGRLLIQCALARYDNLLVDVNEQNPGACRFYESCGFVVQGRSEVDDAGRPFPLLHLRYAGPVLDDARITEP